MRCGAVRYSSGAAAAGRLCWSSWAATGRQGGAGGTRRHGAAQRGAAAARQMPGRRACKHAKKKANMRVCMQTCERASVRACVHVRMRAPMRKFVCAVRAFACATPPSASPSSITSPAMSCSVVVADANAAAYTQACECAGLDGRGGGGGRAWHLRVARDKAQRGAARHGTVGQVDELAARCTNERTCARVGGRTDRLAGWQVEKLRAG